VYKNLQELVDDLLKLKIKMIFQLLIKLLKTIILKTLLQFIKTVTCVHTLYKLVYSRLEVRSPFRLKFKRYAVFKTKTVTCEQSQKTCCI
jgi:hypothetical protein